MPLRVAEMPGVHEPALSQNAANDAPDAASDEATDSIPPQAESQCSRGNP